VGSTLDILVVERGYCLATWDRVFLLIWRTEITVEAMKRLHKLGAEFVRTSSYPVCTLSIVEPTSPPPRDQLRGQLAAFYRNIMRDAPQHVVVAEGGGFRGALVRSVGLALSAIAPKSLPFRFASGIEEAARLLRPHLSPASGGAVSLQQALEEMRGNLNAACASPR
jgi:hypothetical protein